MWVCLFWEAGVMGVCASSSSHIVKASWRCLVGINGDVKPQERGEKEKARGRKCPSLFHEHTHESAEHAGTTETGSLQVIVRKESLEVRTMLLWFHIHHVHPQSEKVLMNPCYYCSHSFIDQTKYLIWLNIKMNLTLHSYYSYVMEEKLK